MCLQKHISEVVSYIRQERALHMPICRQLLKDISASQDHECLTCVALALNVNKSKLGPAHASYSAGTHLENVWQRWGLFFPPSVSK